MNAAADSQSDSKKILMVASNPATSEVTGWPVGFWWSELTHPFLEFTQAGFDVTIASPDGGTLQGDGYSDPEDESGYSADDQITLEFKNDPERMALVENTSKLSDLDLNDYDAIYLVGGQAPMFTFRGNDEIESVVSGFFEEGKPTALVCHASNVLLTAEDSSGDLLVKGRSWTGFADDEERFVEQEVGQKIQPFWIEEEARKIPDTEFVVGEPFAPHAVRDGNLITGQQQNSGAEAAKLVIEALGN